MKGKGYCSQIFSQIHLNIHFLSWVIRMFFSFCYGEGTFSTGKARLAFRKKGRGQTALPAPSVSQVPSVQNIQYTKVGRCGVACPDPLYLPFLA